MSSKLQKLRCVDLENVDNEVYTRFNSKKTQQTPIIGVMLKKKVLKFIIALEKTEFKIFDCWLRNWKDRCISFHYVSMKSQICKTKLHL